MVSKEEKTDQLSSRDASNGGAAKKMTGRKHTGQKSRAPVQQTRFVCLYGCPGPCDSRGAVKEEEREERLKAR